MDAGRPRSNLPQVKPIWGSTAHRTRAWDELWRTLLTDCLQATPTCTEGGATYVIDSQEGAEDTRDLPRMLGPPEL